MIKEENLHHNWKLIQIKDCCELLMGQSPPGTSYNEEGNGMPFLQGKAEFGKTFPNHIKFTTDPKRKTKKGSILMSVRAPVGDVNIANIDYCIGRGLASLNLKNGDNKYLFYLLNYLKPKIEGTGTGSTFKAITKSGLEKIKIPVPPLETQKKIVEILEKAEKLKEWRAEADELADEYLKSVFLEMFGDPVKNDRRWNISLLEKKSTKITDGEHNTPVLSSSGIPYISAKNVKEKITFKDCKYVDDDTYEKIIRRCNPEFNDILVTCVGTIGRIKRIDINKKFIFARSIALIKPDKSVFNPIFLEKMLSLPNMNKYMTNETNEATVKGLYLRQIKKLRVPVPPITLQNQFAQIVQQVETLKTHQSQSKQEIDNLFNTLMQKAFKGELVC